MKNHNTLHVRKRPAFLYIAESFVGFFFAVFIVGALKGRPVAGMYQLIAVVFGCGIYVALWYAAFRITVVDGVLAYRSLLGRTKVIRLGDIERSSFEVGEKRYSDRDRPPVRIFIKPRRETGLAPFDINAAVFDVYDFAELRRILADREPRAKGEG